MRDTDFHIIIGFIVGCSLGVLAGAYAVWPKLIEKGVQGDTIASAVGAILGAAMTVAGAQLIEDGKRRHTARAAATMLRTTIAEVKISVTTAEELLGLSTHDLEDEGVRRGVSSFANTLKRAGEALQRSAETVGQSVPEQLEDIFTLRDAVERLEWRYRAVSADGLSRMFVDLGEGNEDIELARNSLQRLYSACVRYS